MKTIITTLLSTLMSLMLSAQLVIGKSTIESPSAILDFSVENKGIVLPRVLSIDANTAGTLYYDTTAKKVFLKTNATNPFDLSVEAATIDLSSYISSMQALVESPNINGAIIGANSSDAKGVLVLEDNTKAMILPKVASPHTAIINPEPGTIVYDSTKKLLSVYNGTQWSFWKAE